MITIDGESSASPTELTQLLYKIEVIRVTRCIDIGSVRIIVHNPIVRKITIVNRL